MLIFNPRRIFGLRGVERPNSFLVRHGFTSMVASRLLSYGLPNVNIHNIGRLCVAMNCTPNDLFDWKPETTTPLSDNHALQALVREDSVDLAELLKDIPAEKLADLHAMIDELRRK